MGLKVPHAPALPQLTDHVTPAFAASLFTTAMNDCVKKPASSIEVGGAGLNVTEIVPGVMVIVADADFVVSVTEVAVTITDEPVGTAAGAV